MSVGWKVGGVRGGECVVWEGVSEGWVVSHAYPPILRNCAIIAMRR